MVKTILILCLTLAVFHLSKAGPRGRRGAAGCGGGGGGGGGGYGQSSGSGGGGYSGGGGSGGGGSSGGYGRGGGGGSGGGGGGYGGGNSGGGGGGGSGGYGGGQGGGSGNGGSSGGGGGGGGRGNYKNPVSSLNSLYNGYGGFDYGYIPSPTPTNSFTNLNPGSYLIGMPATGTGTTMGGQGLHNSDFNALRPAMDLMGHNNFDYDFDDLSDILASGATPIGADELQVTDSDGMKGVNLFRAAGLEAESTISGVGDDGRNGGGGASPAYGAGTGGGGYGVSG